MNQTVTAILVDDEKNGREVLAKLIAKKHPEVRIIGQAVNVEQAYQMCVTLLPDIVFLDIQMPQQNGFNLLKKFGHIPFEVIFVTSFDHYAITAIKFNALDYLLKPIDANELSAAICKAVQNISCRTNQNTQVINLIRNLESSPADQKFVVHTGGNVRVVNDRDVLIIRANGRYCHLSLQSGETLITARSLKEFEEYFEGKTNFVRISKTHMINAAFVREYSKGDPFIIKMSNGDQYEVSRRKKPEVLAKLRS